jgi:hypothetical protein
MTYTKHEQRRLDIHAGEELDRRFARAYEPRKLRSPASDDEVFKDVEIDMWKPERLSVADMLGTSAERIHTDGGRALPRRRGPASGGESQNEKNRPAPHDPTNPFSPTERHDTYDKA